MSEVLVSIVIPTLTRADCLRRALQSALRQTYLNLEILIVEDGSQPEIANVIESHADPRIRFEHHPSRIGFVANWTFGLRVARGEYVCILGDDDYYEPTFVASRITAFKKYGDVVAVTGAFWSWREDVDSRIVSRRPADAEKLLTGSELAELVLGTTGEWFNGATLYRKENLQAIWEEAMMAGTALDLAVHILLACQNNSKLVYLPEPEMTMTIHREQESVMNQLWLARCAAGSALNLWHLGKNVASRDFKSIMRRGLAAQVSHYARMVWDRGFADEARRVFLAEMSINPWNLMTWMRYFRALVFRK